MDTLLEKARIDDRRLKQLLMRLTATELANIAEPCYAPPLKGPFFVLLREVNLTEKDVRDFTKRLYGNHPAKSWATHNVPSTNLLIFLMNYFIKKRDLDALNTTISYLLVRYYGNLMSKYMPKYCQDGVFRYTLDTLTKTHLFVREGTISGGLVYLAKELQKRFIRELASLDPNGVARFVTEARHRMNQSFKSFAQSYHKAAVEGHAINVEPEAPEGAEQPPPQSMDRVQRTIEEVIRSVVVNRLIDNKALEEAKKLTKIQASIALDITKELTNVGYSDDMKMVFTLFVKNLTTAKQLCGNDFYKYVKGLMAIKRTKSKVYFKQQVGLLLEKVLTKINKKSWYESLTPQTKFITISFLAYYLTLLMRHRIC